MPFIECRHIFTAGHKCESPTLRGELYCYYHLRLRKTPAAGTAAPRPLLTPAHLEDADSVQLALSEVITGIWISSLR